MMLHNPREVMDRTADSRTYRLARRRYIATQFGGCDRCGPHRGENRKFKSDRSWKCYRRYQWRKHNNYGITWLPK